MEAARINEETVPEYPKTDIVIEIKIKLMKIIEIESIFFLLKEETNNKKIIIE
tara:strand:+ start:164 stop:322 length:159 start_codon:yes stop_codon:yes gene_type:complete